VLFWIECDCGHNDCTCRVLNQLTQSQQQATTNMLNQCYTQIKADLTPPEAAGSDCRYTICQRLRVPASAAIKLPGVGKGTSTG